MCGAQNGRDFINFVPIRIHFGSMGLRDTRFYNLNWLVYAESHSIQRRKSKMILIRAHYAQLKHHEKQKHSPRKARTAYVAMMRPAHTHWTSLVSACECVCVCVVDIQPLIWYKLISIRQRHSPGAIHRSVHIISTRIDRFDISKIGRLCIEAWQNVHRTYGMLFGVRLNRWAVVCHVYDYAHGTQHTVERRESVAPGNCTPRTQTHTIRWSSIIIIIFIYWTNGMNYVYLWRTTIYVRTIRFNYVEYLRNEWHSLSSRYTSSCPHVYSCVKV